MYPLRVNTYHIFCTKNVLLIRNHIFDFFQYKGDDFPVLSAVDDKLVLLSMRSCPYAQRAHLVLDAKRIPHHVVNIHLTRKPDWLTKYSPLGKVPALGLTNEPGQPYIHESLIICDYLDEKFNAVRSLYPADPLAKALDRLWVERFGGIVSTFYRVVMSGVGGKPAPGSLDQLSAGLDVFEAELKRRGHRFFGGTDNPGMLDYMIWPWFERFESLQFLEGEKFVLAAKRYPVLVQYLANMKEDEAVKKTFLSGEVHHKFIQGHVAGKPDYEMLSIL